ncbi:hypothetical protein P12x_000030 [Tundrisphaera lichenicola]|uniref:hypothetical protein n=1 Tax=Tundrisphaera lichenicola TaxID=2029860 RepID=UPI003EB77B35
MPRIIYCNSTKHLIALLILLKICTNNAIGQDHLIPENGHLNEDKSTNDYNSTLVDILGIDSDKSNYIARMVCLPAFEPEWAITITEVDNMHWIELSVATESVSSSKNPRKVTATKRRILFDSDCAIILRKIWIKMLLSVKYPSEPPEFIVADATDYRFSCFAIGRGKLAGKISEPMLDTLPKKLTEIGHLLRTYVEDDDLEKPKCISKILDLSTGFN